MTLKLGWGVMVPNLIVAEWIIHATNSLAVA
jgi:hypothetical protein